MYIAGIHLPIRETQALEGFVWGVTVFSLFGGATASAAESKRKGGVNVSHQKQDNIIGPLYGASMVLPQAIYVGAIPFYSFEQPEWYKDFALPNIDGPYTEYIRIAASIGLLLNGGLVGGALATQSTDVRGKLMVVKDGPYAVVRHPIYAAGLSAQILTGIMQWNWIPIFSAGFTFVATYFKVAAEEKAMMEDVETGPDYVLYKRQVTSAVIPYIW